MAASRFGSTIRRAWRGFLIQCLTLLVPVIARADGLNGFMEYTYSNTDSTLKDSLGGTTKSSSWGLLQRYNLALDRSLSPTVRFAAGGNAEFNRADTDSDTAGVSSSLSSTSTKFFPYANLTLNNASVTSGVGYSRRQEKNQSSGSPALTSINDNYTAQLGLRPEGLPTVDIFATRFNTYDGDRQFVNTVTDSLMANARYTLFKNLDLTYQWLYTGLQDRLNNLEVQSMSHNARVSYSRQYFNNRVSVYSSYNLASQQTDTTAKGIGDVISQLFPVHGYFKISQFPDTPANGALDQYDQLIAGNGTINIGLPPFGTSDTKPRNVGVEFGTDTTVNTLRILVNQNLGDQGLYTRFGWEVYTSADQGKTWQLLQAVGPENVTFGFFVGSSGNASYAFELKIPQTTTRFLKVVTTPLQLVGAAPQGVDAGNILVTKLETYFRGAAPAGVRTASTLSGHYDMSTRVKLLEKPSLYYDLNFTFDHSKADTASSQRWNVTNSLSLAHSFTPKYSVGARVSREDAADGGGSRSANVFSASFTALPLPTLSNSLVLSGRTETSNGQNTSSYSLFLNNTAELYRGLNVSFNTGASRSFSPTGRMSDDILFLFGASVIPHPVVNLNVSVTGRKEWQSGAGLADSSDYKQDNEISLSINPVKSIYLFGSTNISLQTAKETVITRGFGGSWAPLRDGDLMLNIAYSQSTTSDQGSQTTTSLVQGIRWYFRRASFLDVSYLITNNSSVTQNIDSYSLSTSLRFTF